MAKSYYSYRIQVVNRNRVQVEKRDNQHRNLGQPAGDLRYQEKLEEITPLLKIARENNLNDSGKTRTLGETLFNILFNDLLRQDFVDFYKKVVEQKDKQLLRVELDINEQEMPEIAALPWEFLRLPARGNSREKIWMGTAQHLSFSRYRSQWSPAPPIQLGKNEKLRIALVVSAPSDLPPVAYEPVQKALEKLVNGQKNRVELLPIVNSANPEKVDDILSQEPHIFHFIGHGRFLDESNEQVGEIAFVDDFDEASWVDADYFSDLFTQHRPGVVILQACEGARFSASEAFVGIASSIVGQNIPVVVAMQYEVTNSTASKFACSFYKRLAAGDPVDIAVQSGRRAITLDTTQYKKRDFATPVIFMRVQDGYLFKRENEENGIEKSLPQNPQNASLSNFSSQSNSTNVIATNSLKTQLLPKTKTFDFEVVTIDFQGREKRSYQQAEHLIETLSDIVGLEMVSIPGGQFTMGAPREEEMSQEDERPQHIVTIKPFFIGRYPITQAQWRVIAHCPQINRHLEPDPSCFKGDNLPVERINWYQAQEFCDRLSQKTGRKYRLPTEAEWEYACRARTSTQFHLGNKITENLVNQNDHYQQTTEVGSFLPNAFGLWDMHGLVWEWCEDYEHGNYYNAPSDGSAWINDGNEEYRVLRGGSWDDPPNWCRSASRFSEMSTITDNKFGFRVVFS